MLLKLKRRFGWCEVKTWCFNFASISSWRIIPGREVNVCDDHFIEIQRSNARQ